MTCCAAAICAVVRHSVSSPLPVLGCSALPRHCHACLGAQSSDRARVASACAGTYPQGCSSPRPLCSGVTNQVSAETRLPDCRHALTVLSPALLWLSCASRAQSIEPCSFPSRQGAGHRPRSYLMGQGQLDLAVPRRWTIGAEGTHPPSNLSGTSATALRCPPPPPAPPPPGPHAAA